MLLGPVPCRNWWPAAGNRLGRTTLLADSGPARRPALRGIGLGHRARRSLSSQHIRVKQRGHRGHSRIKGAGMRHQAPVDVLRTLATDTYVCVREAVGGPPFPTIPPEVGVVQESAGAPGPRDPAQDRRRRHLPRPAQHHPRCRRSPCRAARRVGKDALLARSDCPGPSGQRPAGGAGQIAGPRRARGNQRTTSRLRITRKRPRTPLPWT